MNAEPVLPTAPVHVGRTEETRARSPWVHLGVGVASAVFGLLPWLITGARMPVQNLSAFAPTDLPIVLLPFSQYDVVWIFALLVVGAAVAGIAGRALGVGRTPRATPLLLAGLVVPQVAAVVQTATTVAATLQDRIEADLYVAALSAGSLATVAIGVAVAALIARAPRGGALTGLAIGAVAASPWLSSLLRPFASPVAGEPLLLWIVPWITPVLAGVAIAWAGLRSVGRIIAAVATVAIVWIAPALITGLTNALGFRLILGQPLEMLDYGSSVFRAALFIPELALRPILGVVVAAGVGLGVRAVLARRARATGEA
ncbi:hypothetical protein H9651_01215 [Microbacterium sp. Sa4CUA7]|uniref:Integral membrane protein n=1 Tax=Microbacterium pullorum TaxID=2762236 RepID=A0ABR8RYH1_9MICO|nr:hypothetical protein [Microbacterium pullorum]MBD7956256.1 hypothetical protein [Microbacterium pullorum]